MNDLLFTEVELYDGSGREPFMADVAVKGERIAHVAPSGTLKKTGCVVIEGNGLALTPGFVDAHTHSDGKAVTVLTGDSKISQGVTSEITGNCGFSDYLDEVKDNDLGEHILRVRGNFGAYADLVENSRPALNIMHMCGHNTLRAFVMGYEDRAPTKAEMQRMKELLADALEHGAGGFSGGPYYLPGKFASTEELKSLAALLKGTGKPYATHIRSEGDFLLESLGEAFEIARAGDNDLQISHLKTSGVGNWDKIDAAFDLIEKEQRKGMDILADRYPYIHYNTSLRTLVPKPFDVVDTVTLCGKLKDSAPYRKAFLEAFNGGTAWDHSRILITASLEPSHRQYFGKSLAEIAAGKGVTPEEVILELLASGRSPGAAFGTMSEENLHRILAKDYVVAGSDGNIRSFDDNGTHPRAFGTHPRFFRIASRYSSYAAVIRRMTSLPAKKFNLTGRGLVVPGYYADLALLDLERYDSPADYSTPNRRAEGVHSVYVNGQLTFAADPECKTGRAGKMLRIPSKF